MSLDDQLWHQCLATYRCHQEVEQATGARASPDWAGVQQTDDDRVLLRLLDRGISDQSGFDRPFDALRGCDGGSPLVVARKGETPGEDTGDKGALTQGIH